LNRLPQLAEPLLQFDLVNELRQLRGEASWQRGTGRSSKTLAKYPDFRIILVLMKANTQMSEHRGEAPSKTPSSDYAALPHNELFVPHWRQSQRRQIGGRGAAQSVHKWEKVIRLVAG
jgi:hypothetical protein